MIRDLDLNLPIFFFRRDEDRRVFGAVLDRVLDEVRKHLFNEFGIHRNREQGLQFRADLDAFHLRQELVLPDDLLEKRIRILGLEMQLDVLRFDFPVLENGVS